MFTDCLWVCNIMWDMAIRCPSLRCNAQRIHVDIAFIDLVWAWHSSTSWGMAFIDFVWSCHSSTSCGCSIHRLRVIVGDFPCHLHGTEPETQPWQCPISVIPTLTPLFSKPIFQTRNSDMRFCHRSQLVPCKYTVASQSGL